MPSASSVLLAGQSEEKEDARLSSNFARKSALRRPADRQAVVHQEFRQDLLRWVKTDRNTAMRLLDLVEAVMRDPFLGIGKPEPLSHGLAGVWSRRVTGEHRLLYVVRDTQIEFLHARYHY
jgi:toxin YoeB